MLGSPVLCEQPQSSALPGRVGRNAEPTRYDPVDLIHPGLCDRDERERAVIRLRFGLDSGEPRTLEDIGEHFGLTHERIRQIEARALTKLRHPSNKVNLKDLLGA